MLNRPSYIAPASPWPEAEGGFEPYERVVKRHEARRKRAAAGGAGGAAAWFSSRKGVLLSVLGATLLLWLVAIDRNTDVRGRIRAKLHSATHSLHDLTAEPVEPFDRSLVLNFPYPQNTLESQLKPGVRYVTTMSYGGHANQFMAIENLLYLAKLLNRVAIIPTLTPLHFDETPRDFSQFYDLDRFYHETEIPAVELSSVKWWNFSAPPPKEDLSCWSILEQTAGGRNVNDGSINIDVKYFPLPKMGRGSEGFNIWFEAIHDFDFDWVSRGQWLSKVRKELLPQKPAPEGAAASFVPVNRHANLKDGFDPGRDHPPRDELFCLDTTFFMGYEGHGWIDAGQYLRFSAELEQLADIYLLSLFDATSSKDIPPFITVHIRRGDFSAARGLTSLDKFTDAVDRVREKLHWRMDNPDGWTGAGKGREKYAKGVRGEQYAVVATTDEKPGSPFVRQLLDLGWKVMDHEEMNTSEELGNWYPAMIDAAVLARGAGFVGTEWSTFSYLAGLRVK
ncbi:hypothetical protein JCM10213v2_002685 [Rhodosporidiobolus nylandii]